MKFASILLVIVLAISCRESQNSSINYEPPSKEKIAGITVVATRDSLRTESLQPYLQLNSTHTAVVPYGFVRDATSPRVVYNTQWQWWGEKLDGTANTIRTLQSRDQKVMLKPQIWVRGAYTGTIAPRDEAGWQVLEESYTDFILAFAKIAAAENVAIFCMGTEWDAFAKARPAYWKSLIQQVREIYSGKLTYAANWDSYVEIPFWAELDFIGIDAYFPVSDAKTPSIEASIRGWQQHLPGIKTLSDSLGRSVLFTEYGYRSMDYAGRRPWESGMEDVVANNQAQVNLLEAFYREVFPQPYVAGGFLWKYHLEAGRSHPTRYSPQEKPALKTVADHYRTYRGD